MRSSLPAFGLGLLALAVLSAAGTAGITPRPLVLPRSLKTVPVPQPVGIERFVKDRAAAVALGKALFWDVQAGSDGAVACASCHFQAGADTRTTNQLNPGANGAFDVAGPNHPLAPADYPFHIVQDADDRNSPVLRDKDDVAGSQGVHASTFHDVIPGTPVDDMDGSAADPLHFTVGSFNVRRVTGRNTPSAINAVFNVRNFWDGRASRRFNGRNPFGDSDPNAQVLGVDDLGDLVPEHISLDMASTASQAVGPPLSGVEMSAAGRTFMKLGKKMLALTPLDLQEVRADDSVLGPFAVAGGKGLTTTYPDMIRAAFLDKWWSSDKVVDGQLNVIPGVTVPTDGSRLPTDQYSLMEANFSLFWGLAIAAYEATLVSDDTPFDRYVEGNPDALTRQQQLGMRVFMGVDGGNCVDCHSGPEFSGAAVTARLDPSTPDGIIERMQLIDRSVGFYDGGFYNIGVRPTSDDLGLGANDPFGRPLSLARQEQQNPGSVQNNFFSIPDTAYVVANGAFKVPSLRNVELTGPYFHNGGEATLRDVVQFYARGGNFLDQNGRDVHFDMHRLRALIGNPTKQIALVDFLRALTDERVRWYKAPFDHPELPLANGAQGNELAVLGDPTNLGPAADAIVTLPATGRNGADSPVQPFLGLSPFVQGSVAAPIPTASEIALFATDSITVGSRLPLKGDVWCNGGIRFNARSPHVFTGSLTAGNGINVTGDSLFCVGNMLSRGSIRLAPTTFMDGVYAEYAEMYAPMLMPPVPAAPSLVFQAATVNVPDYGIATLAPGQYGTLSVGQGAHVILPKGTYVFDRISLGIGSWLQYDPDGVLDQPEIEGVGEMPIGPLATVTIDVNDIDMARGSIVSQGNAMLSTHLMMNVRSRNGLVLMSPQAVFHGSLLAPTAKVVVSNGCSVVGSIYSRSIEIAELAAFQSHTLQPAAPAVLATLDAGFANLGAGPPSPADGSDAAADANLGLAFELAQNTPNPFKPSTTIRFALPESRNVDLKVFDLAGRAVKTLAAGSLEPGLHTLQWDGTSDRGKRLASGVYFYRLVAGNDRAEKKLVLVD